MNPILAASLLGGLGQWARAQSGFKEWMYVAVMVVGAVTLNLLLGGVSLNELVGPERAAVWTRIAESLLAGMGTTQAVSSSANLAVGFGANPSHAAIPVTNSK